MRLIVAFNKQGVIGVNNDLPWHLKDDLKRFQKLTKNNIVVMGRKTYESLPKRPLPNRINVVITTTPNQYEEKENLYFIELDKSLSFLKNLENEKQCETFIIGGNSIYKYFFEHIDLFHFTLVNYEINRKNYKQGSYFTYFPISMSNIFAKDFKDNYKMIFKEEKTETIKDNNEKIEYQFIDFEKI